MSSPGSSVAHHRSLFIAILVTLTLLTCSPVQAEHPQDVPIGRTLLATDLLAWGELVPDTATTYALYRRDVVYGDEPLLITDTRADDGSKVYSDKESHEIRALTIYRAADDGILLEAQPVVFFVHGGAWTDGYRDWYEFVALPFTGEMGWVTVVIDYRLTSDQVFLADAACPDRETCGQTQNIALRTKAAWYDDNIEDVAQALDWVVQHIDDHGGDAGQIMAFGHSAGGHLVSLLATRESYAELRPALCGVVSMSGAYDLGALNPVFWASAVRQTFAGGLEDHAALSEASPMTYVGEAGALPPFCLLYAQDELLNLTEQALTFSNLLRTSDHDATLIYLAGYSHYSEMESIASVSERSTQAIVNWMLAYFDRRVVLPFVVRGSMHY